MKRTLQTEIQEYVPCFCLIALTPHKAFRGQHKDKCRLRFSLIKKKTEAVCPNRLNKNIAMSEKYKAFKIRGCNNNGKYGVAAKDLKELTVKGCKLLKVRRRVVYEFVRSCQSSWVDTVVFR